MKRLLLLSFVLTALQSALTFPATSQDTCYTNSASIIDSATIPTSDSIKVLVVFVQILGDDSTSTAWPDSTLPSWTTTFVNSTTGGTYSWNNLSQYFNEMSNGDFQVVGDVYDSLVITDDTLGSYNNIGEINYEVLNKIDPYVDFSEYDILDGNDFGSDGKVDFIYMIYRNVEKMYNMMYDRGYYTGIARLELSDTIKTDGVEIYYDSTKDITGGIQMRNGYLGDEYTMYVAAHELGHYLFGAGHFSGLGNLGLMLNGPCWNCGRGMSSWEREHLGWISFITCSADTFHWMTDYMTTDKVIKVPTYGGESFLFEYRRGISDHDEAADEGIYVYHVRRDGWYPWLEVECADGNWNFVKNTITETLSRTTPNKNGRNEMNYWSGDYKCVIPIYHENAAWGDDEDAFDLSFNNVFSPVSNPPSTNLYDTTFTMEVTHKVYNTYRIEFYFSDPYEGPPSKPIGLTCSGDYNSEVELSWTANIEPDMIGGQYKIYRAEVSGTGDPTSWSLAETIDAYSGTTAVTSWTDDESLVYTGPRWLHYKMTAVDTQDYVSVYSDPAKYNAKLPKGLIESENEVKNYDLSVNYPNPFNPSTKINYQLPNDAHVKLYIYNTLGQLLKKLVDQNKSAGRYTIEFNASNLPSGIYFYRIQAGEYVSVKKMLLMK